MIMWETINSSNNLNDLKQIANDMGGFKKLIEKVKNDIGINNRTFKSWNGLFTFILQFNKKYRTSDNKISIVSDPYFKSDSSRYIFALVELDGEKRAEMLGITRELYSNNEMAKKWYRDISKKIHPDVCGEENAEKAMAKLNQLYGRMTQNG